MNSDVRIKGARIFDSIKWHDDADLVVDAGRIVSIAAGDPADRNGKMIDARGCLIVPGFIDLQVNGGGGALFSDQTTIEGIGKICEAHARFGTTALLPTLITDTREVTRAAVKAGIAAKAALIPGFLGLHLEGPHLSEARKGAHDPLLIRPMEELDLDELVACMAALGCLMVTVAPENATIDQVKRLADAGIIVSLGHTDASFRVAGRYAAAGTRVVTHLFNAMSGLGHREPGVVGTALATGTLFASIIADGFHVEPAAMGIAIRGKQGPGQIFLVTDAMSTIGTDLRTLHLNGREIVREGGRLTLNAGRKGRLLPGNDADFVVLTPELELKSTWIGGRKIFGADAHI
ncbi:N-acetylglucosamine-6-phosphate deacetylase (plasmid) [Rhizobium leguminosarum bv. trifolii CB782]|nr:N-acetylglucosamine-6-phosphate deacetylase [Rhizobium leguminosarum bv. trifolii CB782]